MKTYLKVLTGIALLLSACSTGSKVTSGGYDDVYFTPGDNPPPVVSNSSSYRPERQQQPSIRSEKNQEKAASIVDEYFDRDQSNKKGYYLNDENSASSADTLYEGEDENLRSDMEDDDSGELSYSTRLRTFYDPYMYDPFWDSYGWNSGWSIGFGGFYGGWYGGYNPWYTGWYDPWYAYSWGYYPYYSRYPYYGYYGGFGGGGHWDGWHGNRGDRFYGRQNMAGRLGRSSNAVAYGSGAVVRSGAFGGSNAITYRRGVNTNSGYAGTRQSGTRYTVDPNLSTRSARMNPQSGRSAETLMNLRRGQTTPQYSTTRPSTSSQDNAQRYTPTYTRPRTNTQATYNSGTREFNRESYNRSSGAATRYAKPNSYSSAPSRSEYGNSGNYQRRSAAVGSERGTYSAPSYSAPSRSSYSGGGGNYSAPSRSSFSGGSSGSFSGGGGSYSGGSSSGSFSGGGGGGGRRR
jgi:hypothetical protein